MGYKIYYTENALKNLRKIDRHQANIIISWIDKNLVGCDDPRKHGKPLKHSTEGSWRYRVGDYRIISIIRDRLGIIEIIGIGHRREIYE